MVRIKRKQQALLHSLGAARHERGGSGADRLSRRRVDERLSDRFPSNLARWQECGWSTFDAPRDGSKSFRIPASPAHSTARYDRLHALRRALARNSSWGSSARHLPSRTIETVPVCAGRWTPFRETEKKCGDFVWFEADCVERHI